MNIFIDCKNNEYNGQKKYKSQLISMALIDENNNEFYEVLECPEPTSLVRDNVIPVLGKAAISQKEFDSKLKTFLLKYDEINILTGDFEDLYYFCGAIIPNPFLYFGELIKVSFTVNKNLLKNLSKEEYNALENARAAKEFYNRFL